MADFPGLPENIYDYQNQFDYSLWTPGTTIKLCTVPWDTAYRDVPIWDNNKARIAYFDSLPTGVSATATLDGYVYLKPEEPVRVNIPWETCRMYNYLYVQNFLQPVPGDREYSLKCYFYFIQDAKYIAPNTTELVLQLDVWTSFLFAFVNQYPEGSEPKTVDEYAYRSNMLGRCYVERGHVGIANENATIHNLNEYLVEPEGFNCGDLYENVSEKQWNLIDGTPWFVVTATASLQSAWGTQQNPSMSTAIPCTSDGWINGVEVYAMSKTGFLDFYRQVYSHPWISQCVQSIQVVGINMIVLGDKVTLNGGSIDSEIYNISGNNQLQFDTGFYLENALDYFVFSEYSHLLKLYTAPYAYMQLKTYNGNTVNISPQLCHYNDFDSDDPRYYGLVTPGLHLKNPMMLCCDISMTPPNIRAAVYPFDYGSNIHYMDMPEGEGVMGVKSWITPDGTERTKLRPPGYTLDCALPIDDWPSMSIVNDSYGIWLASNARSLRWQYSSADWSQQKALRSAATSYDNASSDIANTGRQAELKAQNMNALNQYNLNNIGYEGTKAQATAGVGTANDALSSLGQIFSGNIAGGLFGIASTALNGATNQIVAINDQSQQTAYANDVNNANLALLAESTGSTMANAEVIRDNNLALARYSAKGDYANTIAGIQAKVQDAQIVQPSTSGQVGGNIFNCVEGEYVVALRFIRLQTHFLSQVADYWQRYGYAINRFMQPDGDTRTTRGGKYEQHMSLQCMTHFTYWKMCQCTFQEWYYFEDRTGGKKETNGLGLPTKYVDTIRGIFEKGVTIWNDPKEMNNIDFYENKPLKGVKY